MISFFICIVLLIVGFLFYSRIIDRNFGVDDRETPGIKNNDGVDYVPLPTWKAFLIELLNIAGTGPIFGALSGAVFGPIVYLWIVFGCVLGGAVHDYNCGMMSVRHNGKSIPEITGIYLGKGMQQVMRVFSVVLLVMCGVVFTTGPAGLLEMLTNGKVGESIWLIVIIVYYFVATFLPIDHIIGNFYPVFGICFILMALGVSGSIVLSGNYMMPELWNDFSNMHPNGLSVWPFMFVTVACGAISGFHGTQSPMVARCIKSEHVGRKVFYGAMIAEGIIALIWAMAGVSVYESSQALLADGAGCSVVVYNICRTTMGKVGMILALLGVIVCPITSGDTAYRAARLCLADWFDLDQKSMKNRLIITVPLLAAGVIISRLNYNIVWRYFSWSNQTLAMITLWTVSVYLKMNGKNHLFTTIPAMFMTVLSVSYFLIAPECLGSLWGKLGIEYAVYYPIGIVVGILMTGFFWLVFKGVIWKLFKREKR